VLAPDLGESEDRHEAARQALFSLPVHYRQVLMFKYVEEMPVLEISQIMGRSPKSIEGLLTRARKELRAKLATPSEG
jgi:RNA polymerase sigma factor (sigma-70 family)